MTGFIDSSYIYALVGAGENFDSHAHKVLRALLAKKYNTYVIHPTCFDIEGIKCAPTLLDIEDRPDVVIVAGGTVQDVTRTIAECLDLDLMKIWVEPQTGYTDIPEDAISAGAEVMTGESILDLI